jgi:hypothetical protein
VAGAGAGVVEEAAALELVVPMRWVEGSGTVSLAPVVIVRQESARPKSAL